MLSIRDLQSRYAQSRVLHGLTLDVPANQVTVLLGRNGMGKTTLIRSIMQLTPPEIHGGTIRFNDRELTGLPPYAVAEAGIGLVPQGRRIFNSLTVRENLAVAERRSPGDGNRTPYDIADVYGIFPRLRERERHLGSELSGGEQQMLAIGRALVTNPRLLLMDEPSEGLAPQIVQRLEERIRLLKDKGMTIFLVEQNLNLGLRVADQVFVVETGTVVWDGSPEELRDNEPLQDQYLGVSRDGG